MVRNSIVQGLPFCVIPFWHGQKKKGLLICLHLNVTSTPWHGSASCTRILFWRGAFHSHIGRNNKLCQWSHFNIYMSVFLKVTLHFGFWVKMQVFVSSLFHLTFFLTWCITWHVLCSSWIVLCILWWLDTFVISLDAKSKCYDW